MARRHVLSTALAISFAFWLLCEFAHAGGVQGPGCPRCGHVVCQPRETTVTEKKHGWDVECKTICIPAIRWPWESCCEPPRCGRVKTVKVLKKVEYACQRCGYEWEMTTIDCPRCPAAAP